MLFGDRRGHQWKKGHIPWNKGKHAPRQSKVYLEREILHARASRVLTAHQYRIVNMITNGLRNSEIATELGIALSTVKNTISIIFDKTGATNRTELAAYTIHQRKEKIHE